MDLYAIVTPSTDPSIDDSNVKRELEKESSYVHECFKLQTILREDVYQMVHLTALLLGEEVPHNDGSALYVFLGNIMPKLEKLEIPIRLRNGMTAESIVETFPLMLEWSVSFGVTETPHKRCSSGETKSSRRVVWTNPPPQLANMMFKLCVPCVKGIDNALNRVAMTAFTANLKQPSSVGDVCAICLETDPADFVELPCGHCFHKSCFVKQIEATVVDNLLPVKCAICRSKVNSQYHQVS